jgi:proline dehydrogenase
MLRQTLLSLSKQDGLRRWMEQSSVARKLTSRFVAGPTLDEEIQVARRVAKQGIRSSLDFLGENVTSLAEAARSRDNYLEALIQIERFALPSTISVKLTQVGLDLSPEACFANVELLVRRAQNMGTRVEIDMESSAYTEHTLCVVSRLQERYPGHVRAVIQAYLRRSEADIERLSSLSIPVRLCKGAYREPASVAFSSKSEVDRNYMKLLKMLLQGGTDPAIASHDEKMIHFALGYIRELGLPPNRMEFQMLYGIRRDLQDELVKEGFQLRLYIPYGEAWYPYLMRRLAERPANLLFLARNLIHQ